ncbi:hypothetical protein BD779DRAFT_1587644 [Infundibulicybe gibba]|nr:hypothetical protein BD779DRAFT_1587644 [Infundibulicybe gibba]
MTLSRPSRIHPERKPRRHPTIFHPRIEWHPRGPEPLNLLQPPRRTLRTYFISLKVSSGAQSNKESGKWSKRRHRHPLLPIHGQSLRRDHPPHPTRREMGHRRTMTRYKKVMTNRFLGKAIRCKMAMTSRSLGWDHPRHPWGMKMSYGKEI